jgi:hypothetical protein
MHGHPVPFPDYVRKRMGETSLSFASILEREDFTQAWEELVRIHESVSVPDLELLMGRAVFAFTLVLTFFLVYECSRPPRYDDALLRIGFGVTMSVLWLGVLATTCVLFRWAQQPLPFPEDYLRANPDWKTGTITVDADFVRVVSSLIDGTRHNIDFSWRLCLVFFSVTVLCLFLDLVTPGRADGIWKQVHDCMFCRPRAQPTIDSTLTTSVAAMPNIVPAVEGVEDGEEEGSDNGHDFPEFRLRHGPRLTLFFSPPAA